MEVKRRRKYDKQFKEEAARLVIEQHQTCRSVEKALGVVDPKRETGKWGN